MSNHDDGSVATTVENAFRAGEGVVIRVGASQIVFTPGHIIQGVPDETVLISCLGKGTYLHTVGQKIEAFSLLKNGFNLPTARAVAGILGPKSSTTLIEAH